MIKQRVIASRYAGAYMKYAAESVGIKKAVADIKGVRDIMRQNRDFKEFLENPQIPFVDKSRIIDEVLAAGFSDEIKHFLKLLIERKRIELYWDVSEYIRIIYMDEGANQALIKTTFPLDLELVLKIKDTFERKFKQELAFYIELDSRLLGGIQVVIGNKIFDGSVKGQIAKLKERLTAVRIN